MNFELLSARDYLDIVVTLFAEGRSSFTPLCHRPTIFPVVANPWSLQLFLPLGGQPCVLVLGAPTEGDKPDPSNFRAFKVNPGDGAIIHLGTARAHRILCVVLLFPARSHSVFSQVNACVQPVDTDSLHTFLPTQGLPVGLPACLLRAHRTFPCVIQPKTSVLRIKLYVHFIDVLVSCRYLA